MRIISRICASLEARLSQPWLNPWRTVYFCLRTMPLRVAVKLPVFIYGRVRLFGLNGRVEFEGTPVKTGMVKIGINSESFGLFDHSGFVQLGSPGARLVFEGPAMVSVNCKLRVVSGTLRMGAFAYLGEGIRVVVNGSSVSVGAYCRIAYETVIMNSGFHHVWNSNRQSVTRTTRPVTIGDYCWIGNRTSISPGAALKHHSIVCAGSLVNKDFTAAEGEYQMLGGSPAKVIGCGFHRVYSPDFERRVSRWFREHPDENTFHLEEFDDTVGDLPKEFFQRVWC